MMRWVTVVFCLFWSSLAGAVDPPRVDPRRTDPAGTYLFRSYGPEQGLRNPAVTALAQDRTGFLYVGTEDGLFRYDGERFHRLGVAEGLPSDGVAALHATKHGPLWVALERGLMAWNGIAPDPRARHLLLPDKEVLGIASSDADRLLVSTTTGAFEGDARALNPVPGVPPRAGAGWLSPDGAEALLAVGGRLYQRDAAGRWRWRPLPPAIAAGSIQAVVKDARGRIWLRGWRLLLRLQNFNSPTPNLSTQLPGDPVHKGELHLDRAGRVWAPTDSGVVYVDGDEQGLINDARGLPNEWATTVLMDREGSLWVGSEGVHRLQGRLAWTSFTRRQGLPADTVWAVLRDRAGTLWAATHRGVAHATAQGWLSLPIAQGRAFYAFAESTAGDFWVGGKGGRVGANTLLHRAAGVDDFQAVPLRNLDGSTVNSLAFGPDGALYAGTMAHGLHRLTREGDGYASAPVVLPGGTATEQINQLTRDPAGRLWVAGMRGLAMYDGRRWHRRGAADGLLEAAIETVAPAAANRLSVTYWNVNGLTLMRADAGGPAVVRHVTRPPELIADAIYSTGTDSRGALWVGTAMGVQRWHAGRLERYGRADGLPSEDAVANAFWADADGDVWFGMANGLVHFDAGRDVGPPSPPVTLITSVNDGRAQLLHAAVPEVAWNDRALTFRFAALSFLDPSQLQRQVRLLGFEDGWRDSDISEARYTGLLPGRYRFQARTRYGTGAFGPMATRTVVVRPPWWLTWWFLALVAIVIVGLLMLAWRWRLAHLSRRNVHLEALVEARTRDLQLAHAAVEEASMVDPLTGLKNRRYLSAFLPGELARCIRQQRADQERNHDQRAAVQGRNIDLCVLIVDLDDFKGINDSHGHAGGDAVLRQVGQVMRATCRESDVVVRWGGEEFLILARNADRALAKVLASTVCDAVREHTFVLASGVELRMTCSVGFTAFPLVPGEPDNFGWEIAVDLADQCLYAAKKSGRDGWVGCLVQDTVRTDAEGALPSLEELGARGDGLILSSFPEGRIQW